jgi:hypothetical protein
MSDTLKMKTMKKITYDEYKQMTQNEIREKVYPHTGCRCPKPR